MAQMEIINQRYQQKVDKLRCSCRRCQEEYYQINIYTNIVAKNLILELYDEMAKSRLSPSISKVNIVKCLQ